MVDFGIENKGDFEMNNSIDQDSNEQESLNQQSSIEPEKDAQGLYNYYQNNDLKIDTQTTIAGEDSKKQDIENIFVNRQQDNQEEQKQQKIEVNQLRRQNSKKIYERQKVLIEEEEDFFLKYAKKKFELTILIDIIKNPKEKDYTSDSQLKKCVHALMITIKCKYNLKFIDQIFQNYLHIVTLHIDIYYPLKKSFIFDRQPWIKTQVKQPDQPEPDKLNQKRIGYFYHFEEIPIQSLQEQQQQLEQQQEQQQQMSYIEDFQKMKKNFYFLGRTSLHGAMSKQVCFKRRNQFYNQDEPTLIIVEKTLFPITKQQEFEMLIQSKEIGSISNEIKYEGNELRPIRDLKFLHDIQQKKVNFKNIINLQNYYLSNEDNNSLFIHLEYFGGYNIDYASVIKFFQNNQHVDLGLDKEVIENFLSQIFLQAVDAMHVVHDYGMILRDFKDDNILIKRTNNDQAFTKLIDFGLSGKLYENSSMIPCKNQYREDEITGEKGQQIQQLPRHDIYSLGIFLVKLYVLYYFPFINPDAKNLKNSDYQDYERSSSYIAYQYFIPYFKDKFPSTYSLYEKLISKTERPNSIKQLKELTEYKNYKKKQRYIE